MTTPTGAADERERLIEEARKGLRCLYIAIDESVATDVEVLVGNAFRAYDETIRLLERELCNLKLDHQITSEQLAAQSAELERVRNQIRIIHAAWHGEVAVGPRIDAAFESLAAPSAAGGEKEG